MTMIAGDPPPHIAEEMQKLASELTAKLIPHLKESRLDIAAMVLAMLLGQNLAAASRIYDIWLETLVDRSMETVRWHAQSEIMDAANAEGKKH